MSATPPPPTYLSPPARQFVQPCQTPCQLALALNLKQFCVDAVKALAYGLPELSAIKWAVASAEMVANPAHPPDFQAIQAAKAWVLAPVTANAEAAALAALQAGFKTPGAWAAQAAAWAGLGAALAAHAVVGAVLLAAALGGKLVPPLGVSILEALAPAIPEVAKPVIGLFGLPLFKKPSVPPVPEVALPGPDGLILTLAQRVQMARNCAPFLKLGCEIGQGKAV